MRVFFFDIDCLRPDHLGCYGYNRPTSPNIDAIAREGVRFSNYYCADSPCLPSRMGLVSGRFGINNGVVSNHTAGAQFHIPVNPYCGPRPENEILMRQMRKHGFDTFSFSNFADRHNAMWFMNGWTEFHTINLKCGFETARGDQRRRPAMAPPEREQGQLLLPHPLLGRPPPLQDGRLMGRPIHRPPRSRNTGPTRRPSTTSNRSRVRSQPTDNGTRTRAPVRSCPAQSTPAPISSTWSRATTPPSPMSTITSKSVLDELERQGLLDDAVIIISSDHGDAFGEHGIYSDHVCADECINHIPLIVRWPGVTPKDRVCDSMLYNIDFSATLLDMIGSPIPAHYDGSSFLREPEGKRGVRQGLPRVGPRPLRRAARRAHPAST